MLFRKRQGFGNRLVTVQKVVELLDLISVRTVFTEIDDRFPEPVEPVTEVVGMVFGLFASLSLLSRTFFPDGLLCPSPR